jgi:hypothetical protein
MCLESALDKRTVIDWRNFMRDLCLVWKGTVTQIGGFNEDLSPIVVELDESAFGKFMTYISYFFVFVPICLLQASVNITEDGDKKHDGFLEVYNVDHVYVLLKKLPTEKRRHYSL